MYKLWGTGSCKDERLPEINHTCNKCDGQGFVFDPGGLVDLISKYKRKIQSWEEELKYISFEKTKNIILNLEKGDKLEVIKSRKIATSKLKKGDLVTVSSVSEREATHGMKYELVISTRKDKNYYKAAVRIYEHENGNGIIFSGFRFKKVYEMQ